MKSVIESSVSAKKSGKESRFTSERDTWRTCEIVESTGTSTKPDSVLRIAEMPPDPYEEMRISGAPSSSKSVTCREVWI